MREQSSAWIIQGRLLTTQEAAQLLAISPETLKWWRRRGQRTGPDFIRLGKRVRYSLQGLNSYLNRRTVGSTRCKNLSAAETEPR